ncbi:MAG: site-specific integrase, partial [Sphingomonadaceae bacterium]
MTPTASEMLEQWRSYLIHTRRRSEHTVRAYLACAERYIHRTDAQGWEVIANAPAAQIRSYLASRRNDGLGNASAARELSALKALMRVAREQTGASNTSFPRIRGPRITKGLPRPVTPDD